MYCLITICLLSYMLRKKIIFIFFVGHGRLGGRHRKFLVIRMRLFKKMKIVCELRPGKRTFLSVFFELRVFSQAMRYMICTAK